MPSIRVNTRSSTSSSSSSSSSKPESYTRNWALFTVDKERFPPGFEFENIIDLSNRSTLTVQNKVRRALGHDRYSSPRKHLLRVHDIIPATELKKGPEGDGPLLVIKPGKPFGLVIGLSLDVRSAKRAPRPHRNKGGDRDAAHWSYEWAILHESARRERKRDREMPCFAACGDAGSVIVDFNGRAGGLLTGGARSHEKFTGYMYDITYATPIEYVLNDIEKEIGCKVRIL